MKGITTMYLKIIHFKSKQTCPSWEWANTTTTTTTNVYISCDVLYALYVLTIWYNEWERCDGWIPCDQLEGWLHKTLEIKTGNMVIFTQDLQSITPRIGPKQFEMIWVVTWPMGTCFLHYGPFVREVSQSPVIKGSVMGFFLTLSFICC